MSKRGNAIGTRNAFGIKVSGSLSFKLRICGWQGKLLESVFFFPYLRFQWISCTYVDGFLSYERERDFLGERDFLENIKDGLLSSFCVTISVQKRNV